MPNWRHHLKAAGLYALLALLLTWPLVTRIGEAFPTFYLFGGGDPNVFIWYIDWAAKIATHQLPAPAGQMLLYPNGVDPLAGFDGPLMFALGVPVTLLTGNPVLAYNVFLLAALVGSALAMYALLFRVTRAYGASVLGGALFGFSTFMLVRLGLHANLIMIGTLPLLVHALLVRGERPESSRALAWLALATLLNALSSWYYAVAGLLLTGLLVLCQYRVWRPRLLRLVSTLAVIGGITVMTALPILLSAPEGKIPQGPGFTEAYGARLRDFVIPPFVNALEPLYRAAHQHDQPSPEGWQPNAVEHSSYVGVLLLALVGIFIARRKSLSVPYPTFWIACFGLFSVLSLGTHLRLFGLELPLPFAALRHVFPFSMVRVPNRLFVPALFCAVVMAAAVIAHLQARGAFATRHMRLLAGAALVLFLAERAIFPYPLYTPPVSAFHRTLAADPETFAITDLPVTSIGFSEYDLLQTVHGKPTTSGEYFYPAYRTDTLDFLRSNPLYRVAACETYEVARPTAVDLEHDVWPEFRARNIRYVVVHNLILKNDPTCGGVQEGLRKVFSGVQPHFTDGGLTVYRVPPAELP